MKILTNRFRTAVPGKARKLIEVFTLSLAAGILAVFFMKATETLFHYTYLTFVQRSTGAFIAFSFLTITISSLLVCLLLKCTPIAAGSGIPQLKVAYWKELGYIPLRPVLVKLTAGIISLGGGASLGREGPTLYLTGGITSVLSGLMRKPKRARRDALTVGAAAGLAAAFNTPLAAITFILEELVGDLGNRYLGAVVLSSVTGALVVQACIGPRPSFSLPSVSSATWHLYLVIPFTAAIASAAGLLFQRLTLNIRGFFLHHSWRYKWLLPLAGGWLTWLIGITVFLGTGKIGIFGLGYGDLSQALTNGIPWKIAGALAAGKILATTISYSFGGCGGIFSPTLFIGAMCGFFVAGAGEHWLALTASDQIILAGVGMCTCLCAVIRAPLTSMLIVFEMTHEFSLIPPLMLGILICEAMARFLGHKNLYTELLLQDGHELVRISPPRDLERWQTIHAKDLLAAHVVRFEKNELQDAHRILESCPYRCFPVSDQNVLCGVVTRHELQKARDAKRLPSIEPAGACYPNETIRDIASRLVQSPIGALVVVQPEDNSILGVITLHDLLRAQASVMDA